MAILLRLFSQRHSLRRSSLEDVTAFCTREDESIALNSPRNSSPALTGRDSPESPPSCGRTPLFLLGLGCCICLLCLLFVPLNDVLRLVVEHQRSRPATYVLTYIVAGLAVPAPLLSVVAGVLMGPSVLAVFVIICGSLGSACFAFAISRFLLRQFVVQRFVRHSKQLQAIDAALQRDSVKLVLCTRMILPFTFNNYFLGTTPVTATTFALSTLLTGIPFAVIYAIIGGEMQNLDNALSAKSFELKSADVNIFGYCTVSKRHLELTAMCAGICLFFFVIRTVKQFANRVIREAQQESGDGHSAA